MRQQSLEDALQAAGNPVEHLRSSQVGPERRAWKETCALLDQSHHMTDLHLEGPDALRELSDLGVNSFKNFRLNQAKQFVACNHSGRAICDAILFYLDENKFNLAGRPPALNWVQYNVESRGYKASAERDERSAVNQGRRKTFRYQIQGPHALRTMQKATGKPAPDIRFFHIDVFTIAGRSVRALRHGMAGQPGWELFGPWEDGAAVRDAIVEAGQEYGIRQVGSRAYPTTCLESAWIPSPLPAIYVDTELKGYRQWLTTTSYEATASLGGSFYSNNITDYYGPFVKFDRDFAGRAAIEKMADDQKDGKMAGLSTYTSYTYNERAMEPGVQVTLVWGEEGRGSTKPTVKRHAQAEIRATVASVAHAEVARVAYRPAALRV